MTLARILLAASLTSLPATAWAQTTWYVDASAVPPGNGSAQSPYTSLQAAIANPGALGGDRIEVAPGTYAEAIDFLGKAVHVVATSGPALTAIDGGGVLGDRSAVVFESGEGRDSVLEGFTVTNGAGTYDPQNDSSTGGGIRASGSSPTIAGCALVANLAPFGGGLFGSDASPRLVDTTVAQNVAYYGFPAQGAGLAFQGGSPLLERVVVADNYTPGDGGGLWLRDVRATLRGCTISGNWANYCDGGGLYADRAVVTLERCTLADNTAFDGGNGGGIALENGGRLTAVGCELVDNIADIDHDGGGAYVYPGGSLVWLGGGIRGNFAADGGGIHTAGATFVADCTLSGNTAQTFQAGSGSGGAVNGPARLFRCLIEGNQAIAGAGSGTGVGGGTYGASLNHCTVVGNTASLSAGGAWGPGRVIDSILWGNQPLDLGPAGAVTYTDVEGGHPGTGNIDADPLFSAPLAGEYTLTAGSPCIDAGDPSGPPDPDGTRADMGAFPFDQGTAGPAAAPVRR